MDDKVEDHLPRRAFWLVSASDEPSNESLNFDDAGKIGPLYDASLDSIDFSERIESDVVPVF